jgi:hypothetical protein
VAWAQQQLLKDNHSNQKGSGMIKHLTAF